MFPLVVLYTTDVKEGGGSRGVQFTHWGPFCTFQIRGYGVIAAAKVLKTFGRKTVRVQVPLSIPVFARVAQMVRVPFRGVVGSNPTSCFISAPIAQLDRANFF